MFETIKNQNFSNLRLDALVVANDDSTSPDGVRRRRVKIRAAIHGIGITDDLLPWATCGTSCGTGPVGQFGDFAVPAIGSRVLIEFQQGDPQNPLYLGGVPDSTCVAPEFLVNYPNRTGFKLSNGTLFYVDMVSNTLHVMHAGTTVDIDNSGNITLITPGTLTATSSGSAKVTAPSLDAYVPTTTFHGNVNVFGSVVVSAGITATGGGVTSTGGGGMSVSGGGSMSVSGGSLNVTSGDINADGISIKGHHHTSGGSGSPTSSALA